MTIERRDGTVTWDPKDFVEYHVTGTLVSGKRFKQVHKTWSIADGINLYRGTKWGVLPSGKRVRLVRVFN